jgi:hypothetical protein
MAAVSATGLSPHAPVIRLELLLSSRSPTPPGSSPVGGEPTLAKDVATAWTALKRPFAARSNQVCPRRNGTTRASTRSLRWKAPAWLRPGSEKKWPSGMRRLPDFACSQAGSASPL